MITPISIILRLNGQTVVNLLVASLQILVCTYIHRRIYFYSLLL